MSELHTRADKLAVAKKKLKEFEARRQRESDSSPVPSVASTADHTVNNGRLSVNSNHSHNASNHERRTYTPNLLENGANEQIYRQQPYVVNMADDSTTNSSSHSLSTVNAPLRNLVVEANISNNSSPSPYRAVNGTVPSTMTMNDAYGQHSTLSEMERAQLQHERDAAVAAYDQVSAQLEQLRTHYTQLHAAYSSVTSNGIHSDVDRQIQQLQSALAVLVEEKTAVQAEMRKVKNDLEQERILNENLTVNVKSLQSGESKEIRARLQECERLLSARSVELDGLRKSEANAQAQLLAVQHERSQAQARLKVIAREKDVLDSQLKQVRKDLHMKEIYLKQLGPHGIVNSVNDENTIKSLHDRIDALQNQVGVLTNERDQMHHNTAELNRHYETCRLEFVNTRDRIQGELAEAVLARDAALMRVKELENDVSVLRKELCQHQSTIPVAEEVQDITAVSYTEEDVKRKMEEAKRVLDAEWQRKFDEEGKVVDSMMREKDQKIFEGEQVVSELQMRLRLLEERSAETRASGSDLLSLSEQLQNEKATVSRAVAQNRELKEQLLETEDRLLAVTEEKLQSEMARQTAEHQVKELEKKLHELNESGQPSNGSMESATAESTSLEAVMHPSVSLEPSRSSEDWEESERDHSESRAETSREREHMLETQLEMANQQIEEIRADLRRSHTRNEEMNQILRQNAEDENQNSIHVELGQAVARIHELAAENQQLRESIERVVEERSQLELSLMERCRTMGSEVPLDAEVARSTPSTDVMQDQPQNEPSGVGSAEWARSELEKRFSQAMHSNAELRETLDRLEHVNVQLQLENDTIADHVILYQHQRRLIRERLRAKDEQLAAMEADRAKTLERCQELQKALMEVLGRTGALKEYEIRDRSNSNPTKKIRRRVARSYSHSTVDEFSGDEDVPPRTSVDSVDESALSEEGRSESVSPVEPESQPMMQKPLRSISPLALPETDAAVRKILQIITDISKPSNPCAADKLHCTQCIGEIQTL
ncbi:hypothetical protein Aduo_003812 [Ancylostoma duodenale]